MDEKWMQSTDPQTFVGTALVMVALLFLFRSKDTHPQATNLGPVGVWKVPNSKVERCNRADPAHVNCLPPDSFRYDGRYVTLCLIPQWSWEWHPADLYWRLESRWKGQDLYARSPYGNWGKVATFVDGRFFREDGWRFEKVDRDALDEWERALLRRRPPHDYTVNPSERGLRHTVLGRLETWVRKAVP